LLLSRMTSKEKREVGVEVEEVGWAEIINR
jgi:hypothetical protein